MIRFVRTEAGRRRLVLIVLLLFTCVLGSRGLGDESATMLGGDMARYVMNGVFVHDVLAEGGVSSYDSLVQFAERYYAKYPALSLGHHPPIPYLSVVPFFWIFGVTIFAARVAALLWFIAAAWGLYSVASRLFNWRVASWAAALFVTNLVVLRSGQYLLSEMPAAALTLWALRALLWFCDAPRPSRAAVFAVLVVASLYAKQLAILMFPVYVVALGTELGWRVFLTRRTILVGSAIVVASLPLAMMTVGLAPANLGLAISNAARLLAGARDESVNTIVGTIVATHLSLPAIIVVLTSIALLIWRRRRQVLIGIVWIACVVSGSVVFAGAIEPARYAFGALPAYSLLIAALASEASTRGARIAATVTIAAIAAWQTAIAWDTRPSGALGYEEAARYVLAENREPAVLYESPVDTGYFIFFTRKHDVARRQVVVRTDKVLPPGSGDPNANREILHGTLQRLGIRWIVLEDVQQPRGRFAAYLEEIRGPRFALRQRIPVVSTAAPDLSLAIYEYLDARPADLDVEMAIDLPFGGRDYTIRLRDAVEVAAR